MAQASGVLDPVFSTEEITARKRESAERIIRETYAEELGAPVEVEGLGAFTGGFESAARINGAIGLYMAIGESTAEITDIESHLKRPEIESLFSRMTTTCEKALAFQDEKKMIPYWVGCVDSRNRPMPGTPPPPPWGG